MVERVDTQGDNQNVHVIICLSHLLNNILYSKDLCLEMQKNVNSALKKKMTP